MDANEPGTGSTLVVFDLDGCGEVANQPSALHEAIRQMIVDTGLTPRDVRLLDTWGSKAEGPSTSFTPLEESHVRVHTKPVPPSDEFVRTETWPDRSNHVNGEVQVCNYSRDNRQLPYNILHRLRVLFEAQRGSMMVIERGPDRPMRIIEGPLQFGYVDSDTAPRRCRQLTHA